MKFASHYNPPEDVRLSCPDASLTQQEFADDCDINKIMDRYAKGMGALPLRTDMPLFGDFTNVPDVATAFDLMRDAEEKFLELPSDLRTRFDNDPAQLIDFLSNSGNRSEAIKLGLIADKPAPASEAHKQDGGTGDAEGN